MEGQIAKIIIPMQKNQTVTWGSHELVLAKTATTAQSTLVIDFSPLQK